MQGRRCVLHGVRTLTSHTREVSDVRFKSMLTLAFAAMVAIALAVPALASANWTENGKELSGSQQWSKDGAPLNEAGVLSLAGPFGWSSPNGGIQCSSATGSITLNAGSGAGQLTELTVDPSSCKITGGFVFFGCQKITSVSAALPSGVTATESGGVRKIVISGAAINYKLEGTEGCQIAMPEMTVSGDIVATPDNGGSISTLTLSGTASYFAHSGGKVTFSGKGNFSAASPLSVSPAAKYGIIPSAFVSVSGTAGFTSPDGSLTCSVNGTLTLKPGTEGQITSLNWSSCSFSGAMVFACGGTSATVTSNSLPWTIVNQGSSIKIANVQLSIKGTGCSTVASGELIATPNKASAISSTSLSGTLSTFGANRAWSGSLNWTPAGVYGL